LASPPDRLEGFRWNPEALRIPRVAAAARAPARAPTGSFRLAVDPLVTSTRTKAQVIADQAAAGCGGDAARFNVPWGRLEVRDLAFALAPAGAPHAFSLRVGGRTSELVELLEIVELSTSGPRKVSLPDSLLIPTALTSTPLQVKWRYWGLTERSPGFLKFAPLLDNGSPREIWQPWQDPTTSRNSEMLMVWSLTEEERAAQIVSGVYTLDTAQHNDLQEWCARTPQAPAALTLPARYPAFTRRTCVQRVPPRRAMASRRGERWRAAGVLLLGVGAGEAAGEAAVPGVGVDATATLPPAVTRTPATATTSWRP